MRLPNLIPHNTLCLISSGAWQRQGRPLHRGFTRYLWQLCLRMEHGRVCNHSRGCRHVQPFEVNHKPRAPSPEPKRSLDAWRISGTGCSILMNDPTGVPFLPLGTENQYLARYWPDIGFRPTNIWSDIGFRSIDFRFPFFAKMVDRLGR